MDGITVTKISNILKRNIKDLKMKNLLLGGDIIQLLFHGFDKALNISLGGNLTGIYYSREIISTSKRLNYLDNSIIRDVYNISFERVIYLQLMRYRGSGKKIIYTCIFELFSKYPNFYVLDENNKIIFMLKDHFLDTSRNNSVGGKYVEVRSNKEERIDKSNKDKFELMQGFYNVTIHYANILASEYGFERTKKLILDSLADENFYIDSRDRIIPFPFKGYKNLLDFDQLSQYYNSKIGKKTGSEQKEKILKYLNKIKRENEKALVKINNELNEAKDYKNYIERAELLKNNIHLINKKTGIINIDKYTEKGIEKIAFDLKEGDVKSYIEKLFNRGKKLKRAWAFLEERIKKIEKKIVEIDKQIHEIENLEDQDIIDIYANYYFEHKKNKEKEVSSPFFKVRKGEVLYIIGKNKKSNNILITKVSHKDDLWFHAKDAPSAHVIAKKSGPLTDDELIFGAQLAATFSKVKNEQKVEVDYTLRKYITKPKKAPEGYVRYNNFKTLYVEPFKNLSNSES